MTTKILSNAVVIPQDPGTGIDTTDDAISAAGAALLASHEQGSYVRKSNNANSLSFANVDTSNNEVDVKAGVAYIVDVSGGTHNDRSTDGNPQLQSTSTSGFDTEIPNRQPYCVIIPNDQVDLSLDSGVNDVFLEVRERDQNDPILRFGSSVTTGANALKLGTVDTSNGNTTRANDKPSPEYNALETEQAIVSEFIRLATGQAIEDGSGSKRFSIESGGTRLRNEVGDIAFSARDGKDIAMFAYSGEPVRIKDQEGSFNAVQYTTGTSTGTLELTKANLEFTSGLLRIGWPSTVNPANQSSSRNRGMAWPDQGGGSNPVLSCNDGGEIYGIDDAGNVTILT